MNQSTILISLVILTLISATGMLLYVFKRIPNLVITLLIGLGAGSMLAVSLVHILTESLEQSPNAIYAFIAGFLIIYVIEEFLTPHQHGHKHDDHVHEDPHEHYNHVALVSFIAIFTHTLLDGLGIRAGMGLSEATGYAVLFGVAVHQVPVSLSLAAIFRESKFTRNVQITFLALFALAAPIGYVLSDVVLNQVDPATAGMAAAVAGGSLLYVATVDLLPVIHSQGKNKLAISACFIIGAVLMTAVKLFE